MVDPSPTAESAVARLQGARIGADRIEVGRALARLENALFARAHTQMLGRYVLIERLGQGGAGVVWLAHDPELDRRVAIKLLRHDGLVHGDRRETEARLVREARALAHLSHPNVVEVYGVERVESAVHGEAPRTELVLVMELVPGVTLARWLDGEPRDVDAVLPVFLAAGQGLAAVHDLGLVHLDFKPANVMLDEHGPGPARIKVVDFGLAGAATHAGARAHDITGVVSRDEPSSEQATLTSASFVAGTPLYMAPEQHDGARLDARTDQYAFCISLWIALHGAPPFVGGSMQALAEAKRGRAPRPSRRRGVPRALTRVLLRGLCVEPDRRWPSMRALLAALARSRRSTRGRVAVSVALPVLALGWLARPQDDGTCVGGDERLAGVWDPTSRAALVEHLVDRAGDDSDQPRVVDERIDAYARSWAAEWSAACAAIDAPEHDSRIACLDRARGELAALVEAQRRVDARGLAGALEAVATLPPLDHCAQLGPDPGGAPMPTDPVEAAVVAQVRGSLALALALARAGDLVQALGTARDALERARALGWAPLRADALETVASIEISRGEYAVAEADLREAYFDAVEAGHDVGVVHVASDLVFVVGYRLARHDEGREWARHAEARLGAPAVEPLDEAALRNAMGAMLEDAGDLDAAAVAYERALGLIEAERGADDPDAATLHNNLGNLAEKRGDFTTSEAEHRLALAVRERVLGEDDAMTAMSWNNLGIALHRQGRSADAEPWFRKALAVRERVLGESHPLVARTHMNLGVALKSLDRMADAEAHLRRAMGIFERSLGPTHPDLANACLNLANVLRRTDRLEEALEVVQRARAIYESTLPAEHPLIARATTFMTEIRADRGGSAAGPERGTVEAR